MPEQRDEFTEYYRSIWNIPLLHNERSSGVIQVFWKDIIGKSFVASKLDIYRKIVVRYGDHPRQKLSIYAPKVKP